LFEQQNEQPTQMAALCTVSGWEIQLSESKLTFTIIQRLDSCLAPVSQPTTRTAVGYPCNFFHYPILPGYPK